MRMKCRTPPVFHLTCIQSKVFITWNELECLSKAVGLPPQVLYNASREIFKQNNKGLSFRDLAELCKNPKFQVTINYTYNDHSFDWNNGLIMTAARFLAHKVITYDDVRLARISYELLEEGDGRGLRATLANMLNCMKMCNRIISPLKLEHRMKHTKARLKVPNRLQIAELLEILLWCNIYTICEDRIKEYTLVEGKTSRNLWKLDDFMEFMKLKETKLYAFLDEEFIMDEWTFLHETLNLKPYENPPVINEKLRLNNAALQEAIHQPLRAAILQSEYVLSQNRGGNRSKRPRTAASVLERVKKEQNAVDPSPHKPTLEEMHVARMQRRPHTAKEMMNFYLKELYPLRTGETQTDPLEQYRVKRPKTAACVSVEEKTKLTIEKNALVFDMETAPSRYKNYFKEDIESLHPGYWTRYNRRPKPEPAPLSPPPRERKKQRPSKEFNVRISSARTQQPRFHHGNICDARNRGILIKTDDFINPLYITPFRSGPTNPIDIVALKAPSTGVVQLRGFPVQKLEKSKVLDSEFILSHTKHRDNMNTLTTMATYLDQSLATKPTPVLQVQGSAGFNLYTQNS